MVDYSKLLFLSNSQIDKVLRVETGSFFVPAPTGGLGDITRDASATFNTDINDHTFFYGLFSLDGGATWNEFNSSVVEFASGFPVFQTCDVWGESRPGTFTIMARNWYNFVSSSSTARTVLWKVAIIAQGNQGLAPKGNSAEILQFTSSYNYKKIAVDAITPVTLSSLQRTTFVVSHLLGYVPKIRLWALENGVMYDAGHWLTPDAYSSIEIDSSNVYITMDNSNNPSARNLNIYTRVYHND